MFWEAKDESCNNIELRDRKILEVSNGWHIANVSFPTYWEDFDYLIITIEKNKEDWED